ncbi:MAG: hypothetical protein LBT05_17040 [Planctomycetaceae bacterium]|jgi:molecular chaperone GrpE (heat shock protein)|nr:hypothetical protein [Planctomycetaceae bacterium]
MSETSYEHEEKSAMNLPVGQTDSVQPYEIQSENMSSSAANGEFTKQSSETIAAGAETQPILKSVIPEQLPKNAPVEPPSEKSPPESLPKEIKITEQPSESASDFVNESLTEMIALLRQLAKDFDAKLKYDSSKQTLIDKLYSENQSYKEGIVKKFQQSMILAVIEQIDDAEKTISHFENAEFSEESYRKLLKYYSDIAASFRDMLVERFDVQFYRSEPNTQFDPKKQRSLKTVVTNEQSKHKLVKQSLRPGCETEAGFILRPEMVEVYVFVSPQPQN